jgi:hypothetical protein
MELFEFEFPPVIDGIEEWSPEKVKQLEAASNWTVYEIVLSGWEQKKEYWYNLCEKIFFFFLFFFLLQYPYLLFKSFITAYWNNYILILIYDKIKFIFDFLLFFKNRIYFSFFNNELNFSYEKLKSKQFGTNTKEINEKFLIDNQPNDFTSRNYLLWPTDAHRAHHNNLRSELPDEVITEGVLMNYEEPDQLNTRDNFSIFFNLSEEEQKNIVYSFNTRYTILESTYFGNTDVYERSFLIRPCKSYPFEDYIYKKQVLLKYSLGSEEKYLNFVEEKLLLEYIDILNKYAGLDVSPLTDTNNLHQSLVVMERVEPYAYGCGSDPYLLAEDKGILQMSPCNSKTIDLHLKNKLIKLDDKLLLKSKHLFYDAKIKWKYYGDTDLMKKLLLDCAPEEKTMMVGEYYYTTNTYNEYLRFQQQNSLEHFSIEELCYHILFLIKTGNISDYIIIAYNIVMFIYFVLIFFAVILYYKRHYIWFFIQYRIRCNIIFWIEKYVSAINNFSLKKILSINYWRYGLLEFKSKIINKLFLYSFSLKEKFRFVKIIKLFGDFFYKILGFIFYPIKHYFQDFQEDIDRKRNYQQKMDEIGRGKSSIRDIGVNRHVKKK